MIPYDVETLRMMSTRNGEARRFAALEYRQGERDAVLVSAVREARRGRAAAWLAVAISYFSPRKAFHGRQ